MPTPQALRERLLHLPDEPGVYKYFNAKKEIIYVGKAKNLKKRVSSYFTKSHDDLKTRQLVRQIVDFQYTVVATETDALLLENNLIKQHQPHYNILLKDGKSYPYICITKERFPRVFQTRQTRPGGGEYFGPYTNQKTLWALLGVIKKLYPLRTCKLNLSEGNLARNEYRPCLEYHIKNCKAPCAHLQSEAEYMEDIEAVRQILKGKFTGVREHLKKQMQEAAANLKFEEAHRAKSKLEALEDYQSRSLVTNPDISDLEVITIQGDEKEVFVNYFQIERGHIVRTLNQDFKKKLNFENSELLTQIYTELRLRYESQANRVISNVVFELPLENVEVFVPKIGVLRRLVELSAKNVMYFRQDILRKRHESRHNKRSEAILQTLQDDLSLPTLPRHIECFDNSNLQGTHAVASMVCFKDAQPSKKDYRKFNIKTVEGINDFASMKEIVTRRYSRLLREEQPLPDLVIVDGGKGQLSSAVEALQELGLYGRLPIVGLAKRLEEVFAPNDPMPLYINRRSASLRLMQRLRDEAHRFAITFHRDKRSKSLTRTKLNEVPGIGPKTEKKLLTHFRSAKRVREAELEALTAIIGKAKAQVVYDFFRENKEGEGN